MESEQKFVNSSTGTEVGKKEEKEIRETDVKINKHVCFELLPEDENEEISNTFQIDVSVGDVVKKVILMDNEKDGQNDDKHRIDDFYVHFPSSQSRAQERIKQLEEENDEAQQKYCPETEDITDDEEKNDNNVVVVRKNVSDNKDKGITDTREAENIEEEAEMKQKEDIKEDKAEDENKDEKEVEVKNVDKVKTDIEKTKDSERLESNAPENKEEIRKIKTIEKEESDDDPAKEDDGKNIKGDYETEEDMDTNEGSKLKVDNVEIDSENENVDNDEIHKNEEDVNNDPDLVYMESGSNFEDNLNEKWKTLQDGTVLKR